ncbi:response regulator [Aurantiacibacter gangjinensis]|uniref:Uncharacterized protein n=1 Tax=Aurantiacibacter gangjinensis TaxID=502682 RepID=A0A0G9MRQ2_9SPHN|nr:response regulator [Aurantiacibacter gangjinensis]APE28073.1 Two-component system regulatory protein [Aurantiacibacter gangjinensis]KLE31998.1 hypothetical protein AAW01_11250 [Aurantiacibacter gangjinensis]
MKVANPSVLVVEDEVFVAWDEAQALQDAGYDVVGPAHDLFNAMNMAKAEEPVAAVLDINLGDKTVWPLAEQLTQAGVPFLFVSADLQHPQLKTDYAAVPRLTKPVCEADLIGAVKKLLAEPAALPA